MRRATWLLFVLSLLLVQRTHVSRAQRNYARQGATSRENPTIKIPGQGSVLGKEVNLGGNQRLMQYLGIPYAQPPVGNLRFARPVTNPLPSWSDVRNASQFAPSCQQVSGRLKLHEKLYKQLLPSDLPDPGVSEDCLFLNIFVPDGRADERWPVMVWFHGGDFNTGTPAIWDASMFVSKQKVLVVTVAYRLNILGFFTTTDTEAPGNYGMFDQIAALDWIKRNIKYFNGSPDNIVIYGHSSGAISVGLHILSPLSRGKFSKAIAMSGDAVSSVGSPETELGVVDVVADKFSCFRRPTSALMECLRRVKVEVLVQQTSDIETWGPIVDAEMNNSTVPFLALHPKDILDSGDFNAVPLIVGYTNNEQALAYIEANGGPNSEGKLSPESFNTMITDEFSSAVPAPDDNSTCEVKPELVANTVLFFYKPYPPTTNTTILRDRYLDLQMEKNYAAGLTLLAGKMAKHKVSAFVYRFDYRPRTQSVTKDVPEWVGVPHMFELPFVWGLPHLMGGTTQWNFADKKMSDTIMSMLTNFAKSDDPSFNNQIKWEPFTEDNPGILLIDKNIDMNRPDQVDYRAFAFWNEYYPQILEEATSHCCNVTSKAAKCRIFSHGVVVCLGGVVATVALRFRF
ncbi:carboxylesterase 1C isoform X2 [Harpegnathos saltator]|uniref:Fatty acyl-CoA hydrolase, medium chain n=1 Tax=Harpegnathos saltator TaxID=610380 RepID=E2BY80_HARSA|nr:carboxylesterase 1C isoform X2 [Harpegnathos saltator]EFN79359.1 Fatty acyl-CoA hydrolase precursor, medium chain [Harpegnathos saltator]